MKDNKNKNKYYLHFIQLDSYDRLFVKFLSNIILLDLIMQYCLLEAIVYWKVFPLLDRLHILTVRNHLANVQGKMSTLLKVTKLSMPLLWFSPATQKIENFELLLVAHWRHCALHPPWLSTHLLLHQPFAEGGSNPWDFWQIEILNLLGKHERRHARSTTLEFQKLWHSWLGLDLHFAHLTIRSIVLEALDSVWVPTLKIFLQSGNGFNTYVSTSLLRLIISLVLMWCSAIPIRTVAALSTSSFLGTALTKRYFSTLRLWLGTCLYAWKLAPILVQVLEQ